MDRYLIPVVVGVGLFLGARFLFPEKPEVRYERVEVPVEVIVEQEPDTVIKWRERIVIKEVAPTQVVMAPGGALDQVTEFCKPQVLMVVDTVEAEPPSPMLLLRSVSTSNPWPMRSQDLTFTGPTSHGDLMALHYESGPGWSARAVGDSILLRQPRLWWWKDLVYTLVVGGIGYAIGGAL